MANLNEVVAQLDDAKAKLKAFAQTEGKQAIGAAFAALFEAYPKLNKIVWRQYTPHFNDGDQCVFSVHDPDYYSDSADDDNDGDCNIWRPAEFDRELGKGAAAACERVWNSVNNEELLEAVFGDGVQISVTRGEITVEDFDHD